VRQEFSSVVRINALLRAKDQCEACGSRQQLELHHVGHRGDASLFNCLVLCARCHQAEHAEALTALPIRSETIDGEGVVDGGRVYVRAEQVSAFGIAP
jgi:hypothetical protein